MREAGRPGHLRRHVLTSRNIRGRRFACFVLGGLNRQIEHSGMPGPSLRRVPDLVRARCGRHGLTYHQSGICGSYSRLRRHLHAVGASLLRVADAG